MKKPDQRVTRFALRIYIGFVTLLPADAGLKMAALSKTNFTERT